ENDSAGGTFVPIEALLSNPPSPIRVDRSRSPTTVASPGAPSAVPVTEGFADASPRSVIAVDEIVDDQRNAQGIVHFAALPVVSELESPARVRELDSFVKSAV